MEQLERRLLLTVITGDITNDQHWTPDRGPYEIQGHVRLLEGIELSIAANTEVRLVGTLEVNGEVVADQASFRFMGAGDLHTRKRAGSSAQPRFEANDSQFLGNPQRSDDFLILGADTEGVIRNGQFDEHLQLRVESGQFSMHGSEFTGSRPVRLPPGSVDELYANTFAAGTTIEVAGRLVGESIWRPFSGVSTYEVGSGGVVVDPGASLRVEPQTELVITETLWVEGRVELDQTRVRFDSFGDIYLEGAHSLDGKGHLDAHQVEFLGNPHRTDDLIFFEANSTGSIHDSEFDADVFLRSETTGLMLQRNTFASPDPMLVLPGQVEDLYDNRFASPTPVWLNVAGDLTADSVWRPFSNVRGYSPWLNAPPRGFMGLAGILPGIPVAGRVDYVDLEFTRPLRPQTLTTDKITITATGSGGRELPVTGVEILTATRARVRFAEEIATVSNQGTYHVRIAPSVQDSTGSPIDGNHDGVPNQAGDFLQGSFELRRVVPQPRDLAVSSDSWTAGELLSLSWTVSNPTPWELRGGWTDHLYLSQDALLDDEDNRYDVDDNGAISPLDALIVINRLNRHGGGGDLPDPVAGQAPPPYYDIDGDGRVAPLDALIVINYLNRRAGGEGEASATYRKSLPASAARGPLAAPRLDHARNGRSGDREDEDQREAALDAVFQSLASSPASDRGHWDWDRTQPKNALLELSGGGREPSRERLENAVDSLVNDRRLTPLLP